jgi:hypothetical protein
MRESIIYNMCDILRIYKVINVLDVLIGQSLHHDHHHHHDER